MWSEERNVFVFRYGLDIGETYHERYTFILIRTLRNSLFNVFLVLVL